MKKLLIIFFLSTLIQLHSQDADLMLSKDYEDFIDRMVISGKDQSNFHLVMKPYNRTFIDSLLRNLDPDYLNDVERKRYDELVNILDIKKDISSKMSKKSIQNNQTIKNDTSLFKTYTENDYYTPYEETSEPVLGVLYTNPAHFYQHRSKSLYLSIDPILNLQGGVKNNQYVDASFQRGIDFLARIDNKVSLYSQIIEGPLSEGQHVRNYTDRFKTLPYYGFFLNYKNSIYKDYPAYDILYASGGVGFKLTNHIGMKFGYDSNKIGSGFRSTFLDDFAGNYLNLKINTKIWKFHYQNIFAELNENNASLITGDKDLVNKKYYATHTLSFYASPKFQINLTESVIFGRENHFEFQYLNPIILYRTVERALGSTDNVNLGLGFDWYIANRLSWYSQLNFDEFKASEIFAGNGWWANKYAVQTGFKFIDLFNVPNLDVQLEGNLARPYTYGHRTTVTTYTHNNSTLAFPIGANFYEFIGHLVYNPTPKLKIEGHIMYNEQGISYGDLNYGEKPQVPYLNRPSSYGNKILQGIKVKTAYGRFDATYQLRQNYFWNITSTVRKSNDPNYNKVQVGATTGLRINFSPRNYIF